MKALKLDIKHPVPESYQDCSNNDLRLTLTFFMARSNMGKKLEDKVSWEVLKTFVSEYSIVLMAFG